MADTTVIVPLGPTESTDLTGPPTATISQTGSYAVVFTDSGDGTQNGTLEIQGAGTVATINSVTPAPASSPGFTQTFRVDSGTTLVFNNDIGNSVNTRINLAGTLEFTSNYQDDGTTGPTVDFGPGGGVRLDDAPQFKNSHISLNNFGPGNSIDYAGSVASSVGYNTANGELTLFDSRNNAIASFRTGLADNLGTNKLTIAPDGNGGTYIGWVCFLRGTHLATPEGEQRVEDLAVGDQVSTLSGEPATITWIGKRTFKKAAIPRPAEAMPIRIRKDALAPNVPHADLLVSPAHCLYLEGSLIPAQFLINGCTIAQDLGFEEFEYFHIELDRHRIVIAENTPTESYLDTGNRSFFANPGVVQLLPDHAPKSWDDACAPFVTEGPALLAAKQKLLARTEQLGFRTAADPLLRLRVDGHDLAPAAIEGAVHRFVLPQGFADLRIISRSSVAGEVSAASTDDRRRLGVSLNRIVLTDGAGKREIPIDHPLLSAGFHDCERQGDAQWRWTNGEAQLPIGLIGVGGQVPTMIDLHVQGALPAYRIDLRVDVAAEFRAVAA